MILQALQELMNGRTTFVIAQRLRTVMRADEIVVLDRGRIVQRGSHAELLQQEGLYRTIFDLELKDQEEALGAYQAAHANGHRNGNGVAASAGSVAELRAN
jgi:ATP-binding cassette subfamily B protein